MTVTADAVFATRDDEREAGGAPVDLAVVFTDLEGFTAFTATEGDDAAGRLLLAHYRYAEQLALRRGGRVVKRLGDGLLLVFASPPAAVLTCLELRETAPLPLRAGVHRGGVNVTADHDVVGHVVNLASRVAASARPGELLVTNDVRTVAAALSCLLFDAPTTRRFKGIDELVPVSTTSRTACDWSRTQLREGCQDQEQPRTSNHRRPR
ncbi:MAG: adenylate/guanylate cyclase domain-containing protein [Acidimicrobiales bacterium]|nr:adenylate/guanylate cyclase domain-containing protein [Acidimicrobiales bacterium]